MKISNINKAVPLLERYEAETKKLDLVRHFKQDRKDIELYIEHFGCLKIPPEFENLLVDLLNAMIQGGYETVTKLSNEIEKL